MQARGLERDVVGAPRHGACEETGVLQHLDVLGNAIERDIEPTGDLGDGRVPVSQVGNDGAADGLYNSPAARAKWSICSVRPTFRRRTR